MEEHFVFVNEAYIPRDSDSGLRFLGPLVQTGGVGCGHRLPGGHGRRTPWP